MRPRADDAKALGAIWESVRLIAPLASLLIVLLPGCYESFLGSPAPDGTFPDGALLDGTVDLDGGTRSPPDAPAFIDAGPPSNPCLSGELVSAYTGGGCSGTTVACLAACGEPGAPPTCSNDCIDVDPECRTCVNQTLIACANRGGCQPAWDAFACCAATNCPAVPAGPDRLACPATGACVAELEDYLGCLDETALVACDMEVQACFGGV